MAVIRSETHFAGVYTRTMHFQYKGDKVEAHDHFFGHVTYVTRGSGFINDATPGKEVSKYVKASDFHNYIAVPAEVMHELVADEDDTIMRCVFANRDHTGEVVQRYQGNMRAHG